MDEGHFHDEWLRINRKEHALDYLVRVEEFIAQVPSDRAAWKWVIVGLNGALYVLAVLGCKGLHVGSIQRRDGGLISFFEAFRRCRNPSIAERNMASGPLVLTSEELDAMEKLRRELRNPIEHFVVGGWSIEVSGMPRLTRLCLDICESLVANVIPQYELEEEERAELRRAIDSCRVALSRQQESTT